MAPPLPRPPPPTNSFPHPSPGNILLKVVSRGNCGKLVENRSKLNVREKTQLECHLWCPLCPSSWSRLLSWPQAHSVTAGEAPNLTSWSVCLCAPVTTLLCVLFVKTLCVACSLEHHRCHVHSQMRVLPGAYVHTHLWGQVGPRVYETEREVLRDDQRPADAMISRGLGCSQIFREKGNEVTKAGRNAQGGWRHNCHTLAPGPSLEV